MSMSRHAIQGLLQTMQARSQTITPLVYPEQPQFASALVYLENQLADEQGAPTIRLRHMGQLVKHYFEELQTKAGRENPAAVFAQLDEAMRQFWVHLFDVQTAIRHARKVVGNAQRPKQESLSKKTE